MGNGDLVTPAAPEPDPRDLRCSDRDREQVADVLRGALADGRLTLDEMTERLDRVYAARTYRDLEPILSDLPSDGGPPVPAAVPSAAPAPAAASRSAVDRIGATPSSTNAVAIMGGATRAGTWVVPTSFTALAVMGGVKLDLREALFESRSVTITAVAFWGGVDITVGPDVQVVVDGIGVMGAFEGPRDSVGDAVSVRVTGLALMGGVDVKRKSRTQSASGSAQDQS